MKNYLHFIGIGGIGMSALAEFCLMKGARVSGSDIKANALTERLASKGAVIHIGHSSKNLEREVQSVIYSTGIAPENPERVLAAERGVPQVPRMELLKEILDEFSFSVGVTGTHGKTTTSGIISHVLRFAGKDPSVFLGGVSLDLGSNVYSGSEELAVAEIDESDGHFRGLAVSLPVITNIEPEHLEHYADFEHVLESYRAFVDNTPQDGPVIFNSDDPVLNDIARSSGKRLLSFGFGPESSVSARKIVKRDAFTEFDLLIKGFSPERVRCALFGRYNVMNMLAAAACCSALGLAPGVIARGIGDFRGMRRRFDMLGSPRGIKVFEDYAHHPTEIRAVIGAARDITPGRVIVAFQPHRYTRTLSLLEEFRASFSNSDVLFLTDIYPAGEDAIAGVTSEALLEGVEQEQFIEAGVVSKDRLAAHIAERAVPGDTVLVLGAGDISEEGRRIVEQLKELNAEVIRP